MRQGKSWKVARLGTAWSLAGAKLFVPGDSKLEQMVRVLAEDGRKFRTVDVIMVES